MTDSTDSTDSPDEALSAILARRGDDGLVVTDAGLHIVEISAEAAALAERPPAELAGLSLIAAFGSAPLDVLARSALGAGEPASGEAALGPLAARQFEAQAIPLPSGGLLLWLHDVTAARRAAQARRDVVANISHELRTPLASIKLLAETLSDGAVAGGVRAAADPARLAQALLNLAHNAVKYSHRGGEIRLGWDPTPGGVRFWVADDGIGVPLAHRERIFERFYKADRARARGARGDDTPELGGASAGLGLAIVRHIAEAHGGTVGVESEENVGSTFWVEVPQVQA
jgi:signal transduction histidine kinase